MASIDLPWCTDRQMYSYAYSEFQLCSKVPYMCGLSQQKYWRSQLLLTKKSLLFFCLRTRLCIKHFQQLETWLSIPSWKSAQYGTFKHNWNSVCTCMMIHLGMRNVRDKTVTVYKGTNSSLHKVSQGPQQGINKVMVQFEGYLCIQCSHNHHWQHCSLQQEGSRWLTKQQLLCLIVGQVDHWCRPRSLWQWSTCTPPSW